MPYCSKCDMEFIEGITVCSDCGGLLSESGEAPVLLQEQQLEEEVSRQQTEYEAMQAEYEAETDNAASDSTDKANEMAQMSRTHIYITKSQKYSDFKSSASAFLLVGAALISLAVLCWINIITANLISKGILTLLGLISLYVADRTNQSAKKVRKQIGDEEVMTRNLTDWFLASYTGRGLDEQILRESGELEPEELSLKRLDLIQDLIITNHHITDQSYADTLAEDLYEKLYQD